MHLSESTSEEMSHFRSPEQDWKARLEPQNENCEKLRANSISAQTPEAHRDPTTGLAAAASTTHPKANQCTTGKFW